MKISTLVALALIVLFGQSVADSDTGFLDRSVTIGGATFQYQVYVPVEHSAEKRWPVIVDLHGNGAQGPDGMMPTAEGISDQVRRHRSRFPAVVIIPQAQLGGRWSDSDMEEMVMAQLDRTITEFNGDPARVYLTGFSMGASGAYRIAYRWPDRFAAVIAIAGRVEASDAGRDKGADRRVNPFVAAPDPFAALAEGIKHLPIRIFHGSADQAAPVKQSRRIFEALKKAKANVRYVEYAGASHMAAAWNTFGDEQVIAWMFAQHR